MLVMYWVLNSMGDRIVASFRYCHTSKEFWDSVSTAYAPKKNNAQIYQLRDLVQFKKGNYVFG